MIVLLTILVLIVVWFFMVLMNYLFAKRLPKDTLLAFTGGLGQGKTLIGTSIALKSLKRMRLLWCLGFLNQEEFPLLYSNIPIKIKNGLLVRILYKIKTKEKLQKFQFSTLLTYEHLTMVTRLKEYSIVFVDELGQFADQYSYDNPFVIQYLQRFVRFYRHFLDGRFIYTDQSSDNVTKPIRVRTNMIHNLHGFKRTLVFFYKVEVQEFFMSEDVQSIQSSQLDEPPYFFGHLPFKWFKFLDITRPFTYKRYDSRCFSPLYDEVDFVIKEILHKEYKTDYLIDLPNNAEMKKTFKQQGFIDYKSMMKYVKEWKENTTIKKDG